MLVITRALNGAMNGNVAILKSIMCAFQLFTICDVADAPIGARSVTKRTNPEPSHSSHSCSTSAVSLPRP
jgi:hypothetical protein